MPFVREAKGPCSVSIPSGGRMYRFLPLEDTPEGAPPEIVARAVAAGWVPPEKRKSPQALHQVGGIKLKPQPVESGSSTDRIEDRPAAAAEDTAAHSEKPLPVKPIKPDEVIVDGGAGTGDVSGLDTAKRSVSP